MASAARLGTPRVPAFSLLALSAAFASAAFASVVVFLPCFVASNAPDASLALALALFSLPALLVHPITYSLSPPAPSALLLGAVALDALAIALFTYGAPSSTPGDVAPDASSFPRALGLGLACAGTASAIFQGQLIAHMSAYIPAAHLHLDLGIHLSVLECASTSFAAVVPLFFIAALTVGAPLYAPFAVLGIVTVILLMCLGYTLLFAQTHAMDDVDAGGILSRPSPGADLNFGNVSHVPASRPWASIRHVVVQSEVIHPILAMFAASASTSFLRPILSLHLLRDLKRPPILIAVAFAVIQMSILVTNNTATVLCSRTGRRPVIIAGLLAAAVGFRALSLSSWTLISLAVLATGTNTALVLTLGDVAEACDMDVSGLQSDPVMFVSYMAMAGGEMVGVLIAGVLKDGLGTFNAAVLAWSFFLGLVVVVMLVPEIPEMWVRFFGRSESPARPCPRYTEDELLLRPPSSSERQPLLHER